MKNIALMIAGPIISAVGLYFRFRKKNIGSWMQGKRIDQKERIEGGICDLCGELMKRRTYTSGHRKGASALVCLNYPRCKNQVWG